MTSSPDIITRKVLRGKVSCCFSSLKWFIIKGWIEGENNLNASCVRMIFINPLNNCADTDELALIKEVQGERNSCRLIPQPPREDSFHLCALCILLG